MPWGLCRAGSRAALVLLRADLQIAERRLRVDANVFRQAEHALTHDVAHHFVTAASDTHARRPEHELIPRVRAPFASVGLQLCAQDMGEKIVEQLLVVDERHLGD